LCVRPAAGTSLLVTATANRRNVNLEIVEADIVAGERLVPLMLGIAPHFAAGSEISLSGELATVASMLPGASIDEHELEDDRVAAQAHVSFYDARYFAEKRRGVTRKYRRMTTSCRATTATSDATVVVAAGPGRWHRDSVARRLVPDGSSAITTSGDEPRISRITFHNLLAFRAAYDGHNVVIDYDKGELTRLAAALERRWRSTFGEGFVATHRGAIWYLTKYFTPHPPGEPHFFVKPWAFVRTPNGWSSLLEGVHGSGYDVMRGVVATDRFHATPAVFQLHGPITVDVHAGAPLLRVYPMPRPLAATELRPLRWPDEP
jgi:hypothetical protein